MQVLSGDDHDYCEYFHRSFPPNRPRVVREVTVKTISMVMNVRQPGFQLLSLAPTELRTEGLDTYADQLCLLPDQLRIYLNVYIPLLALSILAVFTTNVIGVRRSFHTRPPSDATIVFQADAEDPDEEIAEQSPHYTSPPHIRRPLISLLPSVSFESSPTSRASPRAPGWFALQSPHRQIKLNYPAVDGWLDQIRDAICFCQQGRTPPRRRTVLGTTLLDARDIAIFPLAAFVLITRWVVTS